MQEGFSPTFPTDLIRQKTDFSWVKSVRVLRQTRRAVSMAPHLTSLGPRKTQQEKAWSPGPSQQLLRGTAHLP